MKTKRLKVKMEVEVDAPDNATTEDIRIFLAYEFNARIGLSMNNLFLEEGEYEVITYNIEEI